MLIASHRKREFVASYCGHWIYRVWKEWRIPGPFRGAAYGEGYWTDGMARPGKTLLDVKNWIFAYGND